MQGLFFEPSYYFDDKLKQRQRKKELLSSPSSSQASNSNMSMESNESMCDDVFEAYKKRLKRKKKNRSRSMNSNGIETLLCIEKKRITEDKLSRLFHDLHFHFDKSQRDELFCAKLAILNENKQKNKAIAYALINEYFGSILDTARSNHPLALLITKFCNLFHGQYSFSPEDFKHKSIYINMMNTRRKQRKQNKNKNVFAIADRKNESKVIRKTSKRLDRAINDVKRFVKKLRTLILTLYPQLNALKAYKHVVQTVFHKQLFSQLKPTLGDLYSIRTEDKQCEFAKYMGMWQNLSCKDFGANAHFIEFCLIPSLRPLIINRNKVNKCKYEYIYYDDSDGSIHNMTKQMLARSNAEKIANQLHNNNNNNHNNNHGNDDGPYLSAVLEIMKMPQYDTPEDKIQCVVRTADIIRQCIDKYYENRRAEPIQITPDDLLSLFAYILTQANMHCLWAEVDLIDDFVVDNFRIDIAGYYIATLRAAMQLIVNDIEKLTQTSLNKKKTSLKTTKL